MSTADKLQTIYDNVELVYNAGIEAGREQGGNVEEAYNQGYTEGKENMNTLMMTAIANRSSSTTAAVFSYAFFGNLWNDDLFKPTSAIKPRLFNNGLQNSNVEYGAYTDYLDFSACESLNTAFMGSKIRELGVIDARNVNQGQNGMANAFYNCAQLERIEEFYPSNLATNKAVFQATTFGGCSALKHIVFKSEISQNGLNLKDSPLLDKESIESVINCLSAETTGLTVKLSLDAVNKAFETSEGEKNGVTSMEWTVLAGKKTNWTICLE